MTPEDEARKNREQLSILATFHVVIGILGGMSAGIVVVQYVAVKQFFASFVSIGNSAVEEGMGLFGLFFAFIPVALAAVGFACVVSGFLLKSYRGRLYSQCVAGLLCFAFPFGTILGVMTLIALSRPSVVRLYGS
jgi:hypothetical protein